MEKEIEISADMISAMFQSEFVPVGSVQCFAMVNPPQGYLICDGKEYPCCVYPDLYKAIGNTFGGEKDHTFCVPDLRGQFIRGWSNDSVRDPSRIFGMEQEDCLQEHAHSLKKDKPIQAIACYHDHEKEFSDKSAVTSVGGMGCTDDSAYFLRSSYQSSGTHEKIKFECSGYHSHNINIEDLHVSNCSSLNGIDARVAVETRPMNLALQYCIKAISLVGFTSGASLKLTLNVTENGNELNSENRFSKEQKESFYELIKEECMRKDISTKEDFLNAAGQYIHENSLLNRMFGVSKVPLQEGTTEFDQPIYFIVEFVKQYRNYCFLPKEASEIREMIFKHVNNFVNR